MKYLYLLRHATALPSGGNHDKDRKLAHEGLIEAAALGYEMAKRHYNPGIILCSPAVRTRETLDQLSLDKVPHTYPENMYNASAAELLSQIHQLDETYNSALVIAHNPGIYELTASLCASGPAGLLNRMMGGFRPCTMAVIVCECNTWAEIMPGEHTLKDFIESTPVVP